MTEDCDDISSDGAGDLVFLLDVDNTLLDNDRLKSDLNTTLLRVLGEEGAERFWQLYEEVRKEQDYVDYPTTLQRYRSVAGDTGKTKELVRVFDQIDFHSYLYPDVLPTLEYLKSLGTAVILSDGDQVFQRRKIDESGLTAAVDGHVLIYVHKEAELMQVFGSYPARHYVVVDDKPRILSVLERDCPTTFTTVMVLQGHYAKEGEYQPAPDYIIRHIADLRGMTREEFEASPRSATVGS
jgi:FMN phosphatase YigB (HAD superfamily)